MRATFGMIGLVVVVAVVGLLAKKQLQTVSPGAAVSTPGATSAAVAPQQQVQQMRQAAEAALQTPRAMPDDPK